jgi:hypothetical protein
MDGAIFTEWDKEHSNYGNKGFPPVFLTGLSSEVT